MTAARKVNFRQVLLIGSLTSLILSYCLLWLKMINDPVEYTGADFMTYYTVGTIGQRYGLDRVYDFNLQKTIEEEVVGFEIADTNVLPHNHVPFINQALVFLVTITNGNYILGFVLWDIILIGLYLAAMFVLLNAAPGKIEKKAINVVASMLFFPIFVSLLNGQDTALLILGAAALFFGVLNQRDWAAGLGLALMTVRPHIGLLLALPFIFNRQKVWWWFCAGAFVLVLISVIPLGSTGVMDFFRIMLDTAVRSRETAMVNFIGLVSRSLPNINPGLIRATGWFVFFSTIVGLCVVWKRCKKLDGRILSLAILASLFVVPHLVYHDLALLILPLAIVIWMGMDVELIRRDDVPIILLAVSIILLLSFVWETTQFIFPYLLMGALAIFLLKPERVTMMLKSAFRPRGKISDKTNPE